ncbi:hypothetical protein BS329_11690 [Amycolatopsis coloradensis]|uniref:Uncharacterized protein n=1 Tax=Amycolatopsis coloradensis TaxID=76021 RepID=A0A1R0KWS0_9PSEU|nr:hypothetical protein [Amycolatopsis coloradensis]OLZ53448.1 hypothetical protein BS329_11690 [Amycolatopsis coloradensis]
MKWHQWQEVVGLIGIFVFLTVVITVVVWQFGATIRARGALAREQEYRRLAEKAVQAQEETERKLTELDGRLADLQKSVGSVERILKEVD